MTYEHQRKNKRRADSPPIVDPAMIQNERVQCMTEAESTYNEYHANEIRRNEEMYEEIERRMVEEMAKKQQSDAEERHRSASVANVDIHDMVVNSVAGEQGAPKRRRVDPIGTVLSRIDLANISQNSQLRINAAQMKFLKNEFDATAQSTLFAIHNPASASRESVLENRLHYRALVKILDVLMDGKYTYDSSAMKDILQGKITTELGFLRCCYRDISIEEKYFPKLDRGMSMRYLNYGKIRSTEAYNNIRNESRAASRKITELVDEWYKKCNERIRNENGDGNRSVKISSDMSISSSDESSPVILSSEYIKYCTTRDKYVQMMKSLASVAFVCSPKKLYVEILGDIVDAYFHMVNAEFWFRAEN